MSGVEIDIEWVVEGDCFEVDHGAGFGAELEP